MVLPSRTFTVVAVEGAFRPWLAMYWPRFLRPSVKAMYSWWILAISALSILAGSISLRKISSMYCMAGPSVHHGPDGPHFDAADLGSRDARRQALGLVHVLGFHQVVTGQLLAGLGEGAVGAHHLAVLHPHGLGLGRGAQALAALEMAALDDLLGIDAVFLGHGFQLGRA